MPPVRKNANQSNYNTDYHDDWAWSLIKNGQTMRDVADAFGFSVRTLERWANAYPSFKEAISEARPIANAKVEKALFKRAIGYTVKETKSIVEVDKEGNTKPVRREIVEKHIAPDVGAICFWLKNRDTENWKDKPDFSGESDLGLMDRFTDALEKASKVK